MFSDFWSYLVPRSHQAPLQRSVFVFHGWGLGV